MSPSASPDGPKVDAMPFSEFASATAARVIGLGRPAARVADRGWRQVPLPASRRLVVRSLPGHVLLASDRVVDGFIVDLGRKAAFGPRFNTTKAMGRKSFLTVAPLNRSPSRWTLQRSLTDLGLV